MGNNNKNYRYVGVFRFTHCFRLISYETGVRISIRAWGTFQKHNYNNIIIIMQKVIMYFTHQHMSAS